MASTTVNIEQQKRIRELVLDKISTVDPFGDRPVMTSIGRRNISGTKPEWTKQTLEKPSSTNEEVHGFTVTFAAADWTPRTDDYNYTQLMKKKVAVDLSHEAVDVAGIPKGGELGNQQRLKSDAILNDVEAMLISSNARVQPLPNSDQKGRSGGMQTFIATNVIACGTTKYPNKKLDKGYFHQLAASCKKAGGRPNKGFMGLGAKEAVASWVTQINRNVSDSGKKLTNVINQYETVAGLQDIILHMQLTTVLLMIETGRWETGWLREPKWYPYPDGTADFHGGSYRAEVSLIALAEEANGKITGLDYAV